MKSTNLLNFTRDDSTELTAGMLNRILAKVTGKSKNDSNRENARVT